MKLRNKILRKKEKDLSCGYVGFKIGLACFATAFKRQKTMSRIMYLTIAFAVFTATHATGTPSSCNDIEEKKNRSFVGQKLPYDATHPASTATGAYGITLGALVEAGFIVSSPDAPLSRFFGASQWEGVMWTGKGGIHSRADFLSSPQAQECALHMLLAGRP